MTGNERTNEPPTRRRLLLYGGGGAVALLGGGVLAATTSAEPTTASRSRRATSTPTPSITPAVTPAVTSAAAGQTLVQIPANPSFTFTADLGNTTGAGEASAISAAYMLGAYQVTNAQWKDFLDDSGGDAPGHWSDGTYPTDKGRHPVLSVSAEQAQDFCAWLTTRSDGVTFRLPTEAEWENAARGPSSYTYPWGHDAGTTYSDGTLTSRYTYNAVCAAYYLAHHGDTEATYNDENSPRHGESDPVSEILAVTSTGGVSGWIDHSTYTGFVYTDLFDELTETGGYTSVVGSHPDGTSAYGAHDMAGNVFEWTSSLITAVNGAEAGKKVNAVRGGSWYSTGRSCTTGYRGEGRDGSGGYTTVGFRVAADAV
ncbi:formylglycine-generating enzyme family protein [Streptomyces fulvoviolaceus]|uniref:formylglycine-generating enzyme family protein n=1 Tax=Streptomyces fulvoviolaceus TaxID=285535 RepID=UPI0004C6C539|nr:SUMF1/EgtB/PvdO family nonheme iron enzyme [Streptomyces fulvoviolaceus]MCT9077280.1 formylglycine-generating enzyme family protein [Streptomyces fulvoviolaceus]